jgi:hypothetical protein
MNGTMKILLLAMVILIFAQVAHSQSVYRSSRQQNIFSRLAEDREGAGEITVHSDPKLNEILLKYIEINRDINGIPCYWIRIYSGSGHDSRDQAYQVKAKFLKMKEGIKNMVIYDEPNFKVYVGGYRVQSDALKLLREIQGDFPSAFIVHDIIDFPDL